MALPIKIQEPSKLSTMFSIVHWQRQRDAGVFKTSPTLIQRGERALTFQMFLLLAQYILCHKSCCFISMQVQVLRSTLVWFCSSCFMSAYYSQFYVSDPVLIRVSYMYNKFTLVKRQATLFSVSLYICMNKSAKKVRLRE